MHILAQKKADRENSKSESCEAGVSLTCVIVRFTGCSEWDYYEKNAHKRLDKELPEVFSLQAATAQKWKLKGFLVRGLEKCLFNGNP